MFLLDALAQTEYSVWWWWCCSLLGATMLSILFCVVLKRYCNGPMLPDELANSKESLVGRVVVITGVSPNGIGYETTRVLMERGATIVMAVRDVDKGKHTRQTLLESIANETKRSMAKVYVMHCDLNDLDSVASFCEDFRNDFKERCHMLILNAGIYEPNPSMTKQKIESNFGVNHLAHFLMTCLLYDILIKCRARVIVLTSILHEYYHPHLEMFKEPKLFLNNNGSKIKEDMYSRSKFANILFCKKLDRMFEEATCSDPSSPTLSTSDRAHCYCVHPGLVSTNITQRITNPFSLVFYKVIGKLISKDVVHGAQTTLYCALQKPSLLQGGGYYADCADRRPHRLAISSNMQDDLWQLSLNLCKKYIPEESDDEAVQL